ncbi:MAG: hypothetical protein HC809_15795 [Gammaproteobacteria bacterium]|nr:hypothetical protein [Gammaproteobacteria bacterium]
MYGFTVVEEIRMTMSPYCLCTTVTPKSLASLLEGGNGGSYRDDHPWLAARELFLSEQSAGRRVALILAVEDGGTSDAMLSHWALIEDIDVVTLHRGAWATRVRFASLTEVNPIWSGIDSLMLKAGDDQLRRESLEPIRQHRQALDSRHVHPYAVCETPAFIQTNAGATNDSSGMGD